MAFASLIKKPVPVAILGDCRAGRAKGPILDSAGGKSHPYFRGPATILKALLLNITTKLY